MSDKKDEKLFIRLPADSLREVERVAAHYKTTPSGLGRALIESFCATVQEHGDMVAFPPKYVRYAALHNEIEHLRVAEKKTPWGKPK